MLPAAGVEPGRRLVEHEQVGLVHQAGGEVEPPAHAAGIGPHRPPGGIAQAERRRQLRRPARRLRAAQPGQPADQHEIVVPAQRVVEPRVLPGEPDARPYLPGLRQHVVPEDAHPPRVRPRQGRDDPHQRGLARAVRTEQRGERAGRDGEIDPGEGGDLTERLANAGDLDGRGFGCGPSCHRIAHIVRLAVSEVTGQYGGLSK